MAERNLLFIIGIGAFIATLLFMVRLIAIKVGRDPIMRKNKPGSPEYEVYRRLQGTRKFATFMTGAIIGAVLIGSLVIYDARMIAHEGGDDSQFILIVGPIIAIALSIFGVIVVYNMYVKDKK